VCDGGEDVEGESVEDAYVARVGRYGREPEARREGLFVYRYVRSQSVFKCLIHLNELLVQYDCEL